MAVEINGSSNTITGIAVGGLPDGIVDTDMLAANAVTAAKAAGSVKGISEFDYYYLTTSVTTDQTITSNIIRNDRAGVASQIGTGMSQSSGTFTFPSTGKYLVLAIVTFVISGPDSAVLDTMVTTDNSTYVAHARATDGAGSGNRTGCGTSLAFIDVTDTSQVKVQFKALSLASGSSVVGSTPYISTGFIFAKIGDT
tara:strand:- start:310 stop:900 length:591 start_codon:yes stop_codon:yes gene_type:complete